MLNLYANQPSKEVLARQEKVRRADAYRLNRDRPVSGSGGLSVRNVASHLGVSRSTVYRMLKKDAFSGAYKAASKASKQERYWIPFSGVKKLERYQEIERKRMASRTPADQERAMRAYR